MFTRVPKPRRLYPSVSKADTECGVYKNCIVADNFRTIFINIINSSFNSEGRSGNVFTIHIISEPEELIVVMPGGFVSNCSKQVSK
jgi:hypothetical protein